MTGFVLTFCLALTLPLSAFAARGMAPVLTVNVKDNAMVADVTTVSAQAASESGILKVEFSVDDQLRATLTKAPYEYKWDTVDEDEGRHTLIVAAYDGAGTTATRRIKV